MLTVTKESVGPKIHFRSDKDIGQGRSVKNQGSLGKMNKKILLTEEDRDLFGELPPTFLKRGTS